VAADKPLTLRRQKGRSTTRARQSSESFQVDVLVDTGVFHLEQPFSYFLPEELEAVIDAGSLIKVPFKNDLRNGVVLSIKEKSQASLKPVHSLLTQVRLSQSFLEFTKKVSERYIANQASILSACLPSFTKVMHTSLDASTLHRSKSSKPARKLFLLNRLEAVESRVVRHIKERKGLNLLVILPTQREIEGVIKALGVIDQQIIEIGSHLTSSQRRRNFELAATATSIIVIGTRSAIMAPMAYIDEILIAEESVEHFQEQKAPYWNVRDMALLRSESEHCSITFVSHSISLELARLVEIGWINVTLERKFLGGHRANIATEPNSYHDTIRKALKNGPVLVSVADKGYANTFSCQRCRNLALCECGGRLIIGKKNKYSCSICDYQSEQWRCQICQADQVRIVKGGAEKIVEELGKAFPRVAIFTSTGDKALSNIDNSPAIVVSTFGVEPEVIGGYAGAVLLNGEALLNRAFIRAEEELRFRWFKLATKVRSSGFIYLSLPASHPISQALIGDNVMRAIRAEIVERQAVLLPPSVRIIQVSGEERSISGLRRKLLEQFKELEILNSSDNRTINLKISHQGASPLLISLKALQKYRSAAGQELFLIRVDPYKL
jgi:primosomal protein N' (replication factor Y)